jgi:ABC-type transporter Mla MlaB component
VRDAIASRSRGRKTSQRLTTFEEQEATAVLRLSGNISVACSAELKQLFVQAFSTGKGVQLDLSAATNLDIAAMQLLWAAARHAEKTKTALTAAPTVPEELKNGVRDAGFEHFPVAIETDGDKQPINDTKTIADQVE